MYLFVCLFTVYLMTLSDCIVSNSTRIAEWSVGKNVQGRSQDLIWGIIQVVSWRTEENHLKLQAV